MKPVLPFALKGKVRWLDPAGGVAAPVPAELSSLVGVRRSFASVRRTRRSKGCCLLYWKSCSFPGQSLAEGCCRQASDLFSFGERSPVGTMHPWKSLMRKVVDELPVTYD